MPILKILILSVWLVSPGSQNGEPVRLVLHQYPNGQQKVVIWYAPGSKEVVREECYYENGKLDYSGSYRNDLEHGNWKFYWPNGMLKSEGLWQHGLEEGIHREYDGTGKLIRQTNYLHGEPVYERSH